MIERHAVVQLHLEQLIDGQLASRIGEADDDPVDALGANDRRDIGNRADDAGIEHRLADLCGIRIDESHDLHAERVTKLVKLTRQLDGSGPGADQQQPLARTERARDPLERDAPAGDDDQYDAQPTG